MLVCSLHVHVEALLPVFQLLPRLMLLALGFPLSLHLVLTSQPLKVLRVRRLAHAQAAALRIATLSVTTATLARSLLLILITSFLIRILQHIKPQISILQHNKVYQIQLTDDMLS